MVDFVPKTNWQNEPSTVSPIVAAELTRMENGIAEGTRNATEALPGNVELASSAEMTVGTDLTRAPSVKRVAEYVATAIAGLGGGGTNPAASEIVPGIVELATAAEMTVGTDLTRAPSVKRVVDYVSSAISGLTGGGSSTPATEAVAGIVELASAAEMTTGTDLTRPPSVKRVVDYVVAGKSIPGGGATYANVLVLSAAAAVPVNTPSGTVILRRPT